MYWQHRLITFAALTLLVITAPAAAAQPVSEKGLSTNLGEHGETEWWRGGNTTVAGDVSGEFMTWSLLGTYRPDEPSGNDGKIPGPEPYRLTDDRGWLPTPWDKPPCEEPCVIYGVNPGPGPLAGVWAIDVCRQIAVNILPGVGLAGGWWTVATDSPDSLYLGTSPASQIWHWVIGSPLAPINTGMVGMPAMNSLSDYRLANSLYAGAAVGLAFNFQGLLPAGPLRPVPPAAAFPFGGDLAFKGWGLLRGIENPGGAVHNLVRVIRSTGTHVFVGPMGGTFHGLAFDAQNGRQNGLWASSVGAAFIFTVNDVSGATAVAFPIPVAMFDLASTPRCGEGPDIGDLGDAPDSSNHPQQPMTAYPGISATFPSVFDLATGLPQGPKHLFPDADSWLGVLVTNEQDADLLPDDDGITNIDPPTDTPDRDLGDDGPLFPISLPQCQLTQFQYMVTVVDIPMDRYLNVWIDFNRNGQWGDQLQCVDPVTQQLVMVNEWAVSNYVFNVGPGVHVLNTPLFRGIDAENNQWMRISITEVAAPAGDGSGISDGYELGETEDFLLHPYGSNEYGP